MSCSTVQPTTPYHVSELSMDRMMAELHSQGTKIEDIVSVLKRTPIHPRIIQAIKSAHSLRDSNVFFIDTILEHHGLRECFSEIKTNPGFVDEESRLRIFLTMISLNLLMDVIIPALPHVPGCKLLCPWRRRKTIIGDGIGDFCPSLMLGDGDYVMPRKNFPVWDLICENRRLMKAGVCEWSNRKENEHVLLQLISSIISMNKINSANTATAVFS